MSVLQFPERPASKGPQTAPLALIEQRVQNAVDRDGRPIGKQGLCKFTWIRPAGQRTFFLMEVQEIDPKAS